MNFFVIILLWQHFLYLCTLFLVQRGKWRSSLASLHEKQRTQIQDMLPQQYNEKVHIFNT